MLKAGCVVLLLFLIAVPALVHENSVSAAGTEKILLYEVQPFGSYEGVSLFNYGSGDVNLKDWSISDGEGTLTFVKDVFIASETRLTIVKAVGEDDWFSGRDHIITLSDDRIQKKGSFILADAGDDVYLYRDGVLVDAVCYGSKIIDVGWIGDPVKLPSNKYILRVGSIDTDTLSDWISTKPGLTNNTFDPELYFDAKVTPFSFPESQGIPIFKELENAESEVLISMYLMTSVQLSALLCELASERDVTVRILLEGDVLGNDMTTELTLMRSVVDAGGEVYLINDSIPGNYERFSYFHNKYAVIDGREVIITSENWTSSNLSSDCSNRGWGAIIESDEFAEYIRDVFFSDLNPEYGDIHSLMGSYPGLKPYPGTMTYSGTEHYETSTFDARVMPILSPDDSRYALKDLMEKAEIRLYSQQMDLGSSYRTIAEPSPLEWMSAAADRGVDARFILDSSYGSRDDIINLINSTTSIKAISVNGRPTFSLIHNKGVVVDDTVWVGSVNWTDSSFNSNRELAVIIDSPDVAEFFAGLFIDDWGVNEHTVAEAGLEIIYDVLVYNGRSIHVFTVSGPQDSACTWDILGDGVLRASSGNMIICGGLPPGTHTISVTMDGTEYTAAMEYSVESDEKSPGKKDHRVMIAAGLAATAGVGIMIRKRRDNNQRGNTRP